MSTDKRFKCRFCGHVLPAWVRVAKRPDSALLYDLPQQHPNQVGLYLGRVHRTEGIGTVAAEAYEVVDDCSMTLPEACTHVETRRARRDARPC